MFETKHVARMMTPDDDALTDDDAGVLRPDLFGYDGRLERPKQRQQVALLLFGNFEFVERRDEILDDGVESGTRNASAFVSGGHVHALVFAGSAGCLADEIAEHFLIGGGAGRVGRGVFEPFVDTAVRKDAADKVVDHGSDGRFAAQTLIKRAGTIGFRRRRTKTQASKSQGDDKFHDVVACLQRIQAQTR